MGKRGEKVEVGGIASWLSVALGPCLGVYINHLLGVISHHYIYKVSSLRVC